MKTKLLALWAWFNGKKTLIGAGILVLTPKIVDYIGKLYAIWGHSLPAVTPQIEATILWFGTGLTLIGGVHKLIKYDPTKP